MCALAAIQCVNCRQPYPQQGVPYRCPVCGALFDYRDLPGFDSQQVEPEQPGVWRYRHSFGLPEDAPVLSLGEGNTPLVWAEAFGRQVAFKVEGGNPTGSYKDRGQAVQVSFLQARGVQQAAEDSSGNAGASFAAYAARAGIQSKVFVPDATSRPKRAQIEAYGAELVRIMGPRSNASQAVLRAVEDGQMIYASHAYLPFVLAGYATLAFELAEQMGAAPGSILVPAGQGALLLAIGRGFQALQAAGQIERLPRLVGVQARACAPLWAVYQYGPAGQGWVAEAPTLAEGVRVKHPLRGDALLRLVSENGGTFVAVDEEAILPGRDELAQRGLYVEPTSAIVWDGMRQALDELPEPIAVVLTGSGLKTAPEQWPGA